MRSCRIKLLLCLIWATISHAQTGNRFVRNFLPPEYHAAANNFGVVQDADGLIYVANLSCVLIYDGISWEICKRPDEAGIYFISRTSSGQIVCGASDGDIALISKNNKGIFTYRSLLNSIPEDKRPHEIIRQILNLGESTFFISSDKVVELRGTSVKCIDPVSSFHARAMIMGSHLFVNDVGNHLSVLVDGKLREVNNSQLLSFEKNFFCYPLGGNKYAVGFRGPGTYIALYNAARPWETTFEKADAPCDHELAAAEVNNGTVLSNGNFMLTTNKHGAIVIDKNLYVVQRYNTLSGIYEDNVKFAFEDMNGNIWLATYYGISFIETNSRLFHYTRQDGISGLPAAAIYYKGGFYIATDKGVQLFDSVTQKFNTYRDFVQQCWCMHVTRGKLLTGTQKGVFNFHESEIRQVSGHPTFCLFNDPLDTTILYAGTDKGVDMFRIQGNDLNLFRGAALDAPVKNIAADSTGYTCFLSDNGTLFTCVRDNDSKKIVGVVLDKSIQPDIEIECILRYKGRLIAGTNGGIYTLKRTPHSIKLEKDPVFYELTQNDEVFRAGEMGNSVICSMRGYADQDRVHRVSRFVCLTEVTKNSARLAVINHMNEVTPNAIFYEPRVHAMSICANEGIFFLSDRDDAGKVRFNLILKWLMSRGDTVLANIPATHVWKQPLTISYDGNDITCQIGLTDYASVSPEFSYRLVGRDDDFSSWQTGGRIRLGLLREGSYTLEVKTRKEFQDDSLTMRIPLHITPPWYRTGLAYLFYALALAAFVYLVVRLNSKRLVALNKRLERTIEERTRTISNQKEEIEHKQREILDSINYAQRIQHSLLAGESLLKNNLPEHFVFFKPKDVVSGDFYWASKLADGRFALLCADSTGHGVPGAIMSMLNISCITDAVEANKLTSPGEILVHTRRKIIATLLNDGSAEGGKDGMDCTLICFNLAGGRMTYAAANNPVWIVRRSGDGQKELIELPADKMPVGKHDRDNVPFSEHAVELQSADMIYTFTDGMPDQFGGPRGKKFMYRQLKELLISISELPIADQKSAIDRALRDWIGNLEQVDDICIIGVRI